MPCNGRALPKSPEQVNGMVMAEPFQQSMAKFSCNSWSCSASVHNPAITFCFISTCETSRSAVKLDHLINV